MSKLRKKLSRLSSAGVGSRSKQAESTSPEAERSDEPIRSKPEDLASFRSRLRGLGRGRAGRKRPRKERASAAAVEVGEQVETAWGTLHRTRKRFREDYHHGSEPVVEARTTAADAMRRIALDDAMAGLDLSRALFMDTETTGLAGGTGTVPFLIGIGFFEGNDFVVEQLFLPKLGYEAPMLHYLKERIEAASVLVSYNGKSYDWPLIKARCTLNRVPLPELPPHQDLLHGVRRVLGDLMDDVKLITFEEEILGFHREGDIPGFMIPETYFQFLKDGNADPINPILEHNVHDILALAAMMSTLARRIATPEDAGDVKVQLAVAKLQARAADPAAALAFVEELTSASEDPDSVLRGAILGATLLKRESSFEAAEQLLVRGLAAAAGNESTGPWASEAHLMLAKLYEHQLGSLTCAMKHAQGCAEAEGEPGQQRRIARIERKLEQQQREA
ncbi:MAG: ribonuclease H-like domain-containing protein [Myxococcota bacterium]|nr:ribonuclease H-like domain-containing protein [Myxococcota bacterium]